MLVERWQRMWITALAIGAFTFGILFGAITYSPYRNLPPAYESSLQSQLPQIEEVISPGQSSAVSADRKAQAAGSKKRGDVKSKSRHEKSQTKQAPKR